MAALRLSMADASSPAATVGLANQRHERWVLAILAVFICFWPVYATLSRYNLDIHGDMVENFAWGIGWQLGYYKHPPLYSWIVASWFSVFPRSNYLYNLLSMTSVAIAAFGMWRISTRFFTPGQQVLLVAMVFFLPPLTFLSINYNATSSMAPFWAFTLLFYIRTLERRRPLDAFLVGLIGGLSMLAKYHSVVILAAIFAHALLDREARSLLRTRLPLFAILGGLLPTAPHFYWLVSNDFLTVRYASAQGTGRWVDTLAAAALFVPAMIFYALPGFLLMVLHRYPGDGRPIVAREQLTDLWAKVEGRALLAAVLLPPVFTMLLGLVLDAEVSSLWTIPFFVFVPLLMVSFMPKALADRYRLVVPAMLAIFCAVALALAPMVQRLTLENGRSNSAVPVSAIAKEAQRKWRENSNRRLRIVASSSNFLANGMSFYASDRPYAIQGMNWALTPWVKRRELQRFGGAFLCQIDGSGLENCETQAKSVLGTVDAREVFAIDWPEGATDPERGDFMLLMRLPAPPKPKPAQG